MMTCADAMISNDAMAVYADYLADRGDACAWDVKAVLCMMRQVQEEVGLELHPTGSRYYGHAYMRCHLSDWDFFAKGDESIRQILKNCGWSSGGYGHNPHLNSLYKKEVNLIIISCPKRFKAIQDATNQCLQEQPTCRRHAVKIFQHHIMRMTGDNDDH